MSSISVNLMGAGPGVATDLQGDVLALVSPKAFAPGQPLTFQLPVEIGSAQLQGKSLGSKRRADGHFDLRVRLINLSRSTRERLATLLGRTAPSPG